MADSLGEPQSISLSTPLASPTRARYVVLAFTLVVTAISYLDRVCISMAGPFIQRDLGINDAQMGKIYSAFILAYALFEIPAGWLADRFGPRLMLTRVVVWWSALTALTGWVNGFAWLLAVRFLFGIGEAGTFPGLSRAYARWLPERRHGYAFGLAVMTALLGGALTQLLTSRLLAVMSWRWIFPLYAIAGAVWALAWFLWFRDDPHSHPGVNEAELQHIGTQPPAPHPAVPWRDMLRSRNLLAVCGMYFGVIYGWYFFLTWLPTYLLKARGFNLKEAGWLAMLPMLLMAAGVALGGWWSDRLIKRHGSRVGRRTPGLVGLPLGAAAIVFGVLTQDPKASAWLLALGGGLAAMGVAPGWATCLEIGGKHAGVVTGAMNTFGNLGGALSPIVIGNCVQRWHSWDAPLLTVAFFYLCTAACWLVIDPKKPIPNT